MAGNPQAWGAIRPPISSSVAPAPTTTSVAPAAASSSGAPVTSALAILGVLGVTAAILFGLRRVRARRDQG
jgi:hypothetical protein